MMQLSARPVEIMPFFTKPFLARCCIEHAGMILLACLALSCGGREATPTPTFKDMFEGPRPTILQVPAEIEANLNGFPHLTQSGYFFINHEVQRVYGFNFEGMLHFTAGAKGNGPGEFVMPNAVATDAFGRVFVSDLFTARVQAFLPRGEFFKTFTLGTACYGLATSSRNDKNYLRVVSSGACDNQRCMISEFDIEDASKMVYGQYGQEAEYANWTLTQDADFCSYLVDMGGQTVHVYSPDGEIIDTIDLGLSPSWRGVDWDSMPRNSAANPKQRGEKLKTLPHTLVSGIYWDSDCLFVVLVRRNFSKSEPAIILDTFTAEGRLLKAGLVLETMPVGIQNGHAYFYDNLTADGHTTHTITSYRVVPPRRD